MDTDSESDEMLGRVIASRYRLEARLGAGAMGTVYRARHLEVGRAFAIKILHARFQGDARTRRRFEREAALAGRLRHTNVVSVLDAGELADGRRYIVMEYAEGETLFDLIVRAAPMPAARVLPLVRRLCSGLSHAHEVGLIHRDFKPENVIVEHDRHGGEIPRIADFGVAILRDEVALSGPGRLTSAGVVVGTPRYMAPEQASGCPIDHRVDLFALGVTCFEMLTGQSPFEGERADVVRANVLRDTPAMRDRVPGLEVDPLLEAFTRALLMKSRDARPATAQDAGDLIDLIEYDRGRAAIALGGAPETVVPTALALVPRTAQPVDRTSDEAPAPGLIAPRVRGRVDHRRPQRARRLGLVTGMAATALCTAMAMGMALGWRPVRPRDAVGPALAEPAEDVHLGPSNLPRAPAAAVPRSAEQAGSGLAEVSAPQPVPRHKLAKRLPASPGPTLGPPITAVPGSSNCPPVAPPPPASLPPAPPSPGGPLDAAGLARLYEHVGQRLGQLKQTAAPVANALFSDYLRLRIQDALIDPARWDEASAALHRLDAEISRTQAEAARPAPAPPASP